MMVKNDASLLKILANLDPSGKSSAIVNSVSELLSIKDRIFLKKMRNFWKAPEKNGIKIDDFIQKTKEGNDYKKVGENFLLIIESLSSFEKCYFYGKLWISWLEKKINTNEFRELISMLQIIWISDLEHILYKYNKNGAGIGNTDRLYNCGFLVRKSSNPYEIQEFIPSMTSDEFINLKEKKNKVDKPMKYYTNTQRTA